MFEDYFLDSYKEIYGYYKNHGVDYIVHHSDSYAATLVPDMIDMGIDVYQGCMKTNNIPELIKKYGDKISFMGVIENAFVDHEGWTDEECEKVVRETIDECGIHSFIPCIAQGGPGSVYPGVYLSLSSAIKSQSGALRVHTGAAGSHENASRDYVLICFFETKGQISSPPSNPCFICCSVR